MNFPYRGGKEGWILPHLDECLNEWMNRCACAPYEAPHTKQSIFLELKNSKQGERGEFDAWKAFQIERSFGFWA